MIYKDVFRVLTYFPIDLQTPNAPNSNDDEVFGRGLWHGIERDVRVKGDEAATLFDRKSEQVEVGEMLGTEDGDMMETLRVADAQKVRPEGMIGMFDKYGETRGDCRHAEASGFAVGRRGHDANQAVFRKRARCP